MASHHIQLPCIALFFFFSHAFTSTTKSHGQGFTVELIHRDSPKLSAFFPASSSSNKLLDEIRRSITRVRQIQAVVSTKATAPIIPAGGTYVIDVSIGTPPKRFFGIADTGSDLTWTQCRPCKECFKQTIPIFYPRRSSTYKPLPCNSAQCRDLPKRQHGCSASSSCTYTYSYGDQSSTVGDLSTDTLTIEKQNFVSNFSFGCGHHNQGTFQAPSSGIIGLGKGPLSLLGQTLKNPAFGGKFAYCLVPRSLELGQTTGRGKISFGPNANVSGHGTVSTPMVEGHIPTFYYLTLKSISVGGRKIPYNKRAGLRSSTKGNIIIDSGTTLTFLPDDICQHFLSSLKNAVDAPPLLGPGELELCYAGKVHIPNVTFHFDGADVVLSPVNTFIDVGGDIHCLSVVSAASQLDVAIFGNLAQVNFLVGHDIPSKTVSFKPTNCATYV